MWALNPQCGHQRGIFVLSHMRGATTALSNVLCSHPAISGYGEAHVAYRNRSSLGQLAINQALRGAWSPRAQYLFDKILHNRLDDALPERFFEARAIFLLRRPEPVIRSVSNLFHQLSSDEYPDESAAAQYYLARVTRLEQHWVRFASDRRLGLQSEALLADPDQELARVQGFLRLQPALENRYQSRKASTGRGAGDPLQSSHHAKIKARPQLVETEPIQIAPALLQACQEAHQKLLAAMRAGKGAVL